MVDGWKLETGMIGNLLCETETSVFGEQLSLERGGLKILLIKGRTGWKGAGGSLSHVCTSTQVCVKDLMEAVSAEEGVREAAVVDLMTGKWTTVWRAGNGDGAGNGNGVDDAVDAVEGPPEPMLRWFSWDHLKDEKTREVSRMFAVVAKNLCRKLEHSEERAMSLRKLLEAKDAAVRSAIWQKWGQGE